RRRADLGVSSIDELRKALAEHRVRDLPGFGAKSEEKLARAIQRLDAQGEVGRTPISVALPLATRIVARLREVPGVTHASYCGSPPRVAAATRGHHPPGAASRPPPPSAPPRPLERC